MPTPLGVGPLTYTRKEPFSMTVQALRFRDRCNSLPRNAEAAFSRASAVDRSVIQHTQSSAYRIKEVVTLPIKWSKGVRYKFARDYRFGDGE